MTKRVIERVKIRMTVIYLDQVCSSDRTHIKIVPLSMEQLCWYYIQGFKVCEEYVCFEIEERKEEDNCNINLQ